MIKYWKLEMKRHYLGMWGTSQQIRGLLETYPTFGREKETGLHGALDT